MRDVRRMNQDGRAKWRGQRRGSKREQRGAEASAVRINIASHGSGCTACCLLPQLCWASVNAACLRSGAACLRSEGGRGVRRTGSTGVAVAGAQHAGPSSRADPQIPHVYVKPTATSLPPHSCRERRRYKYKHCRLNTDLTHFQHSSRWGFLNSPPRHTITPLMSYCHPSCTLLIIISPYERIPSLEQPTESLIATLK